MNVVGVAHTGDLNFGFLHELGRSAWVANGEAPFAFWRAFASSTVEIFGSQNRVEEARELFIRLDGAGMVWPYDSLRLSPNKGWMRNDSTLQPIIAKSKQRFAEKLASSKTPAAGASSRGIWKLPWTSSS